MKTNIVEIKLERAPVEAGVIVKLAIDAHAAMLMVSRQVGGCVPQPVQRMSVAQLLEQVSEHVAKGHRVYTCYEAGPCGYGLHRQLEGCGATSYVVAPQRWDLSGRRVKTDRRDARQLGLRLDQYVHGQKEAFSVVRVPTPEQEQRRALCRQRGALLKERQRCELRGHGLALSQGIDAPSRWWEPRVWTDFARELPEWFRAQLEPWQVQAVSLQSRIDELTPRLEVLSAGKWAPKGLGALTCALLEAEILDWGRFQNRRAPGSYSGLCPSETSTGTRRRQGSVNKHGNPRVRHLLVEAAWRMLQFQPHYRPLQRLRAATSSRARKRAVVAAARQLAVDLWRLHTGRSTAEQLNLIMVRL